MILETFSAGSDWISGLMLDHRTVSSFFVDDSGQDMMEYALVAALLSLCAVASLQALSAEILSMWLGLTSTFNSNI